ncbi:hypothetical protein AAG906_026376 [Vitis piasezkii]
MVDNHKDTMTKTGAMLHFGIMAAEERDRLLHDLFAVCSSMRAMQYEKLLPKLKKLLSITPLHAIINYLKSSMCVGVGWLEGDSCSIGVSADSCPCKCFNFLLLSYLLTTSTDDGNDIISLNDDDVWKGSTTYIGKLRYVKFSGNEVHYAYDAQPLNVGARISKSRSIRVTGFKTSLPRVPAGNYPVGHISYELNVLGTRGPRRMQCVMNAIPANAIEPGGVAHTQTEFLLSNVESFPSFQFFDQNLTKHRVCILGFSLVQKMKCWY